MYNIILYVLQYVYKYNEHFGKKQTKIENGLFTTYILLYIACPSVKYQHVYIRSEKYTKNLIFKIKI